MTDNDERRLWDGKVWVPEGGRRLPPDVERRTGATSHVIYVLEADAMRYDEGQLERELHVRPEPVANPSIMSEPDGVYRTAKSFIDCCVCGKTIMETPSFAVISYYPFELQCVACYGAGYSPMARALPYREMASEDLPMPVRRKKPAEIVRVVAVEERPPSFLSSVLGLILFIAVALFLVRNCW